MPGEPYVAIDVDRVTNNRPKAIEILVDGKRIWIPRHMVQHRDSEVDETTREIEIPEWLAIREELV